MRSKTRMPTLATFKIGKSLYILEILATEIRQEIKYVKLEKKYKCHCLHVV